MLVLQIILGILIVAVAYNIFSASTDNSVPGYYWFVLVVSVILFLMTFFVPTEEVVETAAMIGKGF